MGNRRIAGPETAPPTWPTPWLASPCCNFCLRCLPPEIRHSDAFLLRPCPDLHLPPEPLPLLPVKTYLTCPAHHVPRNTVGPRPKTTTKPNPTERFTMACRLHTAVDPTPVHKEEPPLPREGDPTSPNT